MQPCEVACFVSKQRYQFLCELTSCKDLTSRKRLALPIPQFRPVSLLVNAAELDKPHAEIGHEERGRLSVFDDCVLRNLWGFHPTIVGLKSHPGRQLTFSNELT